MESSQHDALDRLPREAQQLIRTSYVPTTEPGNIGRSSGFGGRPHLPQGAEHPQCPNCGRAIPLITQLAIAELPEDVRPIGNGLLQLFYCNQERDEGGMPCDVELDGWAPFSKAHAVRIVTDDEGETSVVGVAHPGRRVVSWSPSVESPSGEELRSLGIEISDEQWDGLGEADIPRSGEKVGGWPLWIQGVEYPDCPICGKQMAFVVQIDSEQNVPVMFGDAGVGHVTQCRSHPEVLAFGWACS